MGISGKELEALVAKLESIGIPEGWTIEEREIVKGKISESSRELDVAIRGKAGHHDILILLECRDWQNPQAVGWLEQLNTKANDVDASQIIAVSPTGFSSGALKTAKTYGISTYTIEEIKKQDISSWFKIQKFTVLINIFEILNVNMNLETKGYDPSEYQITNLPKDGIINGKTPMIIRKSDGIKTSFNNLLLSIDQHFLFKGISLDGKKTEVRRMLKFLPEDRFEIETDKGCFEIKDMRFHLNIWLERVEKPVTSLKVYKNGDKTLSEFAEMEFEVKNTVFKMMMGKDTESGKGKIWLNKKEKKED